MEEQTHKSWFTLSTESFGMQDMNEACLFEWMDGEAGQVDAYHFWLCSFGIRVRSYHYHHPVRLSSSILDSPMLASSRNFGIASPISPTYPISSTVLRDEVKGTPYSLSCPVVI